jgi:hypothetical protein
LEADPQAQLVDLPPQVGTCVLSNKGDSATAIPVPEHAARLAAVLALVNSIGAAEVTEEYICAGITLAQHYAAEAMRLFSASQIDGDVLLAKRLLDWLHSKWGEPFISLPDIYQRGLNQIADQKTARKIVSILEDHGWLIKEMGSQIVKGEKRREVWRIVKG